jgi:hypothetical protein
MAENAAVQEATELPLDKCGYAATCCLGLGEDGLEVVLEHPAEKCTASTKRSAESAPGLARTLREYANRKELVSCRLREASRLFAAAVATAVKSDGKARRGEDETGKDEKKEGVEPCFACVTGAEQPRWY